MGFGVRFRREMKQTLYPFTAIVGQEPMRMALLLNAVDPSLGGVLIAGEKGTGKTTAARGLATLLPTSTVVAGCPFGCDPSSPSTWCDGCVKEHGSQAPAVEQRQPPFVELPLGATEDRVVGTLHVEEALRSGRRRFDPGLLAAANRGVLYVDEVNLLDDHLVDLLLDAASSGVNRVEREGLSLSHPARLVLVGTMNPEEGDVRPQLLDRFGASVMVRGLNAREDREEVLRRRLMFEVDPGSFTAHWQAAEDRLQEHLAQAKLRLTKVRIPDDIITLAIRLALEAKAHGHRADLAILKASRALAALLGHTTIHRSDVAECMRLVLRHRLPDVPMSAGDRVDERLDRIERSVFAEDVDEEIPEGEEDGDFTSLLEQMQVPGSMAAGSIIFDLEKKTLKQTPSTPTP